MTKKKKILIGVSAGIVALAVAAAVLWAVFAYGSAGASNKMRVYYFNATTSLIEFEERSLMSDDPRAMLDTALGYLFSDPRNTSLKRLWPDAEGFLTAWDIDGPVLAADFSNAYFEMPSLDWTLFRAAFVLTMTGLPFIDAVRIPGADGAPEVLDGAPSGRDAHQAAAKVVNNPVISPVRLTTRAFTLYFVNETADGLLIREHIGAEVDMDQVEKYIVTQLIEGQNQEGQYPAIPPETKIRGIEIDEYTCYVNLSGDFRDKFNGSPSLARLTLYSIVNSLTENLSHVKRVKFLIDSENADEFKGLPDFNLTFERDDSLVAGAPGATE